MRWVTPRPLHVSPRPLGTTGYVDHLFPWQVMWMQGGRVDTHASLKGFCSLCRTAEKVRTATFHVGGQVRSLHSATLQCPAEGETAGMRYSGPPQRDVPVRCQHGP